MSDTEQQLPSCSLCGSSTSPRARWIGHEGKAICRSLERCTQRQRENEAVARERGRILQELWPLANEANDVWEAQPPYPNHRTEYELGYMNAMHQAIGIVAGGSDDD